MRIWLNVGAVVALLLVNISLINSEFVSAVGNDAEKLYEDQLRDIIYSKTNREENFKKFGLDEALSKKALKKAASYEKRTKQIIGLYTSIDDEEVAESVKNIFCGSIDDLRPRYHAMRYLVSEENQKRSLISLKTTTKLEPQPWAEAISINSIWVQLEKVADPEPDTTLMYVAAMFSGEEQSVLGQQAPWGRGRDWKWSAVEKEYPGSGLRSAEYLAMVHVFTEVGQDGKNDICSSGQTKSPPKKTK